MGTFGVVATCATPTNVRLGPVLTPAKALARLRGGDVALGRIDVRDSLDGVEPGLWALDQLERRGVTVLNGRSALATAHDKLATADAFARAGIPHPPTLHVAPWLPVPQLDFPVVLKPRFGSWGRDVTRCDTGGELARALADARAQRWFSATGGVLQRLIPPCGYDLRIVVGGGRVLGAIMRCAAPGEWRTNVALGARRVAAAPSDDACELAVAASEAVGGDLVGVDLLPVAGDGWMVLEVNGAVEFNFAYAPGAEIFSAVRETLLGVRRQSSLPVGSSCA
jgi:RimK family alpha-L-glutamate ligase